ncbi:MAG: hypothetical protein LBH59_07070 [Planctomycetaceae bacterium]|nr:hypothetical protein [Planctomycetaceae bacterium]
MFSFLILKRLQHIFLNLQILKPQKLEQYIKTNCIYKNTTRVSYELILEL